MILYCDGQRDEIRYAGVEKSDVILQATTSLLQANIYLRFSHFQAAKTLHPLSLLNLDNITNLFFPGLTWINYLHPRTHHLQPGNKMRLK